MQMGPHVPLLMLPGRTGASSLMDCVNSLLWQNLRLCRPVMSLPEGARHSSSSRTSAQRRTRRHRQTC